MNNNDIKLCFVCDDNYVMPTAVAIASLICNKDCDTSYSVAVLGVGISDDNKKALTSLSCNNVIIEVLNLEKNEEFSKLKKDNLHVSTAAIYKFIIANIFKNISKILYVDSDIVIKQDLKALYNTDIEGCYAAVIKDMKAMSYKPSQIVKLGLDHTAYFNSGVILFNLDEIRNNDMVQKMINYRKKGINYFMDQDTFNAVFEEKVKYISFLNNVIMSNIAYFDLASLNTYYELNASSKKEVVDKAIIVHYSSKFKPWDYEGVPFEELWLFYYNKLQSFGIGFQLKRQALSSDTKKRIFCSEPFQKTLKEIGIDVPVLVSLTTYSKRIYVVDKVIHSILNQTVAVTKVILYLSKKEFYDKSSLPTSLLQYEEERFSIRFCEDIAPHKKYYYCMKENPNSIVITVDDDVYYPIDLVEKLLASYLEFPYAVSAARAHLIKFDDSGNLLPYDKWEQKCRVVKKPSMALIATGVGGILYPPNCMDKELYNLESIKSLCLKADDLWLKVMQVMHGTPVVICSKNCRLKYIDGTQDIGLFNTNVHQNLNDIQLNNILKYYNSYHGKYDTVLWRMKISYMSFKTDIKNTNRNNKIKQEEQMKKRGLISKLYGGIVCYQEHGLVYTLKRIGYKIKTIIREL